jgi:hypothetical protein
VIADGSNRNQDDIIDGFARHIHPEHRSEDRQRELDDANQRRRQRRSLRRRAVKT